MTRWGVYIHSPFCRYKCTYCDFDAGVYPAALAERYVDALCTEIRQATATSAPGGDTVDSIYFGGGTPSLFCESELEKILTALNSGPIIMPGAEQTIETTPEAIDATKAEVLRRLGFNRVSIGAETFNDGQLRMMGRKHSVQAIEDACSALRHAGHDNINLDLIVGLPDQRVEDWNHNLDRAFALEPEHLSMYLLEIHGETKLGELIGRGKLALPEDDLVVEMYRTLQDRAARAGYQQYEISNFARPGFASRHNLKYWSDQPYLGFGSNAHSYNLHTRWKNVATPERYIDAINQNGEAIESRWPIEPSFRLREAIFLGLRRTDGIGIAEFEARFGVNPTVSFAAEFDQLVENQLVEIVSDQVRLTSRGMLLSNEVFVCFV